MARSALDHPKRFRGNCATLGEDDFPTTPAAGQAKRTPPRS
jgi:hypothetical protein